MERVSATVSVTTSIAAVPSPAPTQLPSAARAALALLDAWPLQRSLEAMATATNTDEAQQRRQLLTLLTPLWAHPALGVRCSRRDCNTKLGYVAIKDGTAHVVSANRRKPPKDRHGGIWDLADIEPPSGRFEGWVEDSLAGKGCVHPTGSTPGRASGWSDRRTYTCPRCNASYTKTDRELLRLILTAIHNNDREIYLGRTASKSWLT